MHISCMIKFIYFLQIFIFFILLMLKTKMENWLDKIKLIVKKLKNKYKIYYKIILIFVVFNKYFIE